MTYFVVIFENLRFRFSDFNSTILELEPIRCKLNQIMGIQYNLQLLGQSEKPGQKFGPHPLSVKLIGTA